MARKEKFGKLVLLEEIEASLLGSDYRAAKLGPSGLEKIVTLLRLRPALSSNTEVARSLMDQVKLAAQLQNPNILRIFGIGKVESTYYITYEFVEGRSLQQVLERCRLEGYPFAVDHALLIASKVAAALEYVHARKTDAGARMFHGLLAPATVIVSYEGEVRLKSFGYWLSRVREGDVLLEAERRYLAPEQSGGRLGDARSDVFGLGAILFETLTGQPPAAGTEPADLVGSARLTSPSGDDDSVPKPLADILHKSLALDPQARFADVAEMRKAIDTLLFSGDFTPTTFNLAFFMHSLFREDVEREAKALKDEREASYAEYLAEDPGKHAHTPVPAKAASHAPDNKTEPFDPRSLGPARPEPSPEPDPVSPAAPEPVDPVPAAAQAHPPNASSPGISAKEAAGSFTFHKDEPKKSKTPALLGVAAVLLLAAGGIGYALFGRAPASPTTPPPTVPATLSADTIAAQQRVKELEEKLHALEAEKQAAEAKAADDAKIKLEAQAKAKGQEVDQAAVLKAEEEARQKTRKEQERKQQEELKRLEDQKRAEEARIAEERRRADETAAAQRLAAERAAAEQAAQAQVVQAPPPTTLPEPPSTTTAAAPAGLRPGTLVNLSDPGVIAPILERKPQLAYPPIALRQRVEGAVSLNVLVDERGTVTDTQVLSADGGKSGLSEAAADYAKRWKYRAATKDGVPVKVWTEVKVVFKLPPQ